MFPPGIPRVRKGPSGKGLFFGGIQADGFIGEAGIVREKLKLSGEDLHEVVRFSLPSGGPLHGSGYRSGEFSSLGSQEQGFGSISGGYFPFGHLQDSSRIRGFTGRQI